MSQVQAARLITPRGEIISLSPEVYEAVLKMLAERESVRQASKAELATLIKETRGKYAGEPSLINTLLNERHAERAREMRRDQERTKRFFKKQ